MTYADAGVIIMIAAALFVLVVSIGLAKHNCYMKRVRTAPRADMLRLFGIPDDTETQPLTLRDMPTYRQKD